jgi:hypothetical protein
VPPIACSRRVICIYDGKWATGPGESTAQARTVPDGLVQVIQNGVASGLVFVVAQPLEATLR